MELQFEAQKGTRLHRYFWAVTLTKGTEENLWWNRTISKWEPYRTNPRHLYCTHAPCKTLKAFKRMLRKFPGIQGRACLVNKYKGYDVYSN
jgi:hypothetical protein